MGHESGSKSARAKNLIASQKEAIDKSIILLKQLTTNG
jgi:hypothetical protein